MSIPVFLCVLKINFMIMRNIFLLVVFFSSLSLFANSEDYKKYCAELKEKRSVEFTPSTDKLEFITEQSFPVFTFGEMDNEISALPTFEAGLILKLSDNCSVIMMSVDNIKKPRPEAYSKDRVYNIPSSTAYMLNNCGTPWAKWLIDNSGGVIYDENVKNRFSSAEQDSIRERISNLREQNERCIKENEITKSVGCDCIFIVRVPDIKKIGTHRPLPELSCTDLDTRLKEKYTECYSIEFYKESSYEPLKMLFFIDANKTTIDECIGKIVNYLKFV